MDSIVLYFGVLCLVLWLFGFSDVRADSEADSEATSGADFMKPYAPE